VREEKREERRKGEDKEKGKDGKDPLSHILTVPT
jgi:hypothetical protein